MKMKIISSIIIISILLFGLQAIGYVNLKFWSPKFKNLEREIFENTKSFNHGTIRDLNNLRLEYLRSEEEAQKEALKDVILHRVATFDINKLPSNLKLFIEELE